jgi:hypothetical protein
MAGVDQALTDSEYARIVMMRTRSARHEPQNARRVLHGDLL